VQIVSSLLHLHHNRAVIPLNQTSRPVYSLGENPSYRFISVLGGDIIRVFVCSGDARIPDALLIKQKDSKEVKQCCLFKQYQARLDVSSRPEQIVLRRKTQSNWESEEFK
jgi:hypothetical protein